MQLNNPQIAEYNRAKMESRLQNLISVVRGTNISILPFITNDDGSFASEKAYSFIRELIRDEAHLQREEIDFLTAFFYCTFRAFSNDRIAEYVGIDSIYEQFRPCSSFQDVLDKARLVELDNRISEKEMLPEFEFFNLEDICVAEREDTKAYSFFISMDLTYMMISGEECRSIDPKGFDDFFKRDRFGKHKDDEKKSIDSQEEMQKEDFARDLGFDSYADCEKYLHEQGYKDMYDYEAREGGGDVYGELTGHELKKQMEEDRDNAEFHEYIDELNKQRKPQWDNYKNSFIDREEFVKQYKQYRKLFFEVNRSSFYDRIESIIYNFMYKNKMSVFVDDDATFRAFDLIEDTKSRLEASLARIRRSNGLYR